MLDFLVKIVIGIIIIGVIFYLMQVSKDRSICEKYCLQIKYDNYSFAPKYKHDYEPSTPAVCTCKKNNERPVTIRLDEIRLKRTE